MQRAVATTVERFGGLDVVVANAGIVSRSATMRAMASETFDRAVAKPMPRAPPVTSATFSFRS